MCSLKERKRERDVYKREPFCVPFFLILHAAAAIAFFFFIHWWGSRYTTLRSDGEKVLVERRHLVLTSRSFLSHHTKIDCFYFFPSLSPPPASLCVCLLTHSTTHCGTDPVNVFFFFILTQSTRLLHSTRVEEEEKSFGDATHTQVDRAEVFLETRASFFYFEDSFFSFWWWWWFHYVFLFFFTRFHFTSLSPRIFE